MVRVRKLRIRLAEEKDVVSLRELLYYQNIGNLPEDEEIIVAEENGRILGAVTAGHKKVRYISKTSKIQFWKLKNVETNTWIFRLFVRKDQRSRGIGKQLVKKMIGHLRKRGIKNMYTGIEPGTFKEISRKVFLASGFTDLGSCVCLRRLCIGTLMKLQL